MSINKIFFIRLLILVSRGLIITVLPLYGLTYLLGQITFHYSIVAISSILLGFAFFNYTVRKIPEDRNNSKIFVTDLIRHTLIVSFIINTIGIILFITDGEIYYAKLTILIALQYMTLEFGRILNSLEKQIESAKLNLIRESFWIYPVITIILIYGEIKFEYVLLLWIFCSIISLLYGLFFLKRYIKINLLFNISKKWYANTFNETKYQLGQSLSSISFTYFDRLILMPIVGYEALGIYSIYATITSSIMVLTSGTTFLPYLPKLIKIKTRESQSLNTLFKKLKKKHFKSTVSLVLLSYLFLLIVNKLNLIELGKDKYYMIILFLIFTIINTLLASIKYYIYINKNDRVLLKSSLYGGGVGLLLQPLLGIMFNEYGVILGMIIGAIIAHYILIKFSKNEYNIC